MEQKGKQKVQPNTFQNMEHKLFISLILEDKAFHFVVRHAVYNRVESQG